MNHDIANEALNAASADSAQVKPKGPSDVPPTIRSASEIRAFQMILGLGPRRKSCRERLPEKFSRRCFKTEIFYLKPTIMGGTALTDAAYDGNEKKILQLLGAGVSVNEQDREYGLTALHLASIYGHLAVVEALLANVADKEVKDKCGQTALHFASGEGHLAVVETLLAEGADNDA